MAEITIDAVGEREFQVRVLDGRQQTTHVVTVPESLGEGIHLPDDLEVVVRESFGFLLEREPASSILRRFSLGEIERYFAEYPKELARRLS